MREDGQRTCFTLGKTPGAQRTLLWDDFEGVFKWQIAFARHRPACYKDQGEVFDGNYALRLYTGATMPNTPRQGFAYRYFPPGVSSRIRFELVFYLPPLRIAFSTGFYWVDWQNGVQRIAGWRWAFATPYWWYINEAGAWTYVDATTQYLSYGCWHRVAFELDLNTGRYISLESDGMRFDAGQFSFRAYNSALPLTSAGLRIAVWINGGGVSQWYDNILVRAI